jgi:hypothetical protein
MNSEDQKAYDAQMADFLERGMEHGPLPSDDSSDDERTRTPSPYPQPTTPPPLRRADATYRTAPTNPPAIRLDFIPCSVLGAMPDAIRMLRWLILFLDNATYEEIGELMGYAPPVRSLELLRACDDDQLRRLLTRAAVVYRPGYLP